MGGQRKFVSLSSFRVLKKFHSLNSSGSKVWTFMIVRLAKSLKNLISCCFIVNSSVKGLDVKLNLLGFLMNFSIIILLICREKNVWDARKGKSRILIYSVFYDGFGLVFKARIEWGLCCLKIISKFAIFRSSNRIYFDLTDWISQSFRYWCSDIKIGCFR